MDDWIDWRSLPQSLLFDWIDVVLGLIVFKGASYLWQRWRYGGWTVHLIGPNGETLVERSVSWRKAWVIFDEDADKAVFLKGVVSPFGHLKTDLLCPAARASGLYREDRRKRTITTDLRHNPGSGPALGPAGPGDPVTA